MIQERINLTHIVIGIDDTEEDLGTTSVLDVADGCVGCSLPNDTRDRRCQANGLRNYLLDLRNGLGSFYA